MRLFVRLLLLVALPIACAPNSPSPIYQDPPPPPQPVVTAVTPTLGSAEGGAPVQIHGTGFESNPIVRFGGAAVRATLFNGTLYLATPPHAVGLVDVEVVNQTLTGVLAGAYTFAEPDTFDFNGVWQGYFGETDLKITVTVESNAVRAVTCGGTQLEMSPAPPIGNGRFSYSSAGGQVTGRILAANWTEGTIALPPCTAQSPGDWWGANKDGTPSTSRRRR